MKREGSVMSSLSVVDLDKGNGIFCKPQQKEEPLVYTLIYLITHDSQL
ncbi:MAG: hypothetical protein PVI97_14605 [Candidatus Thiodiazotropha sp.]|jgi:hypothetical protein